MDKEATGWRYVLVIALIKALGVAFATLVFAKYTPLVDSQLYLSGFYSSTHEFRTGLVQLMAMSLNRLGSSYVTNYAFALISATGLIYYYLTGGRRWLLMLTLLFPSALVWSSIVGKEAIYCGSLGLALVVWSSYTVRSLRWGEILILFASLILCFSFRPHYAVALAWLFVAAFAIKNLKSKAPAFLLLILLTGVLLAYYFVWEELLFRGYSAVDYTARASRFNAYGILPFAEKHHAGFIKFKSIVHYGVVTGIVGPVPSEVLKRIEFLPFFLEGVGILLSPLLIYAWSRRYAVCRESMFKRFFWWCVIPSVLILMIMHAPFGLLNPGSATRWRVNFEQIFYLAPLLLMYRYMDEKPNENTAFSP